MLEGLVACVGSLDVSQMNIAGYMQAQTMDHLACMCVNYGMYFDGF